MNTTENIHGHEVLRLVHEAPVPLTRPQLDARITECFGTEARFCTCSAADMTREDLLSFLLSRGKIVERHGLLATDPSRICNHPEGAHAVADLASEAGQFARHRVSDATESASAMLRTVKDRADEYNDGFITVVRNNPYKSLAVAAGIGLAAGLLLRRH